MRPPLKTRNANVEGEGDVAPLESAAPRGAAVGKARAAAGATGGFWRRLGGRGRGRRAGKRDVLGNGRITIKIYLLFAVLLIAGE